MTSRLLVELDDPAVAERHELSVGVALDVQIELARRVQAPVQRGRQGERPRSGEAHARRREGLLRGPVVDEVLGAGHRVVHDRGRTPVRVIGAGLEEDATPLLGHAHPERHLDRRGRETGPRRGLPVRSPAEPTEEHGRSAGASVAFERLEHLGDRGVDRCDAQLGQRVLPGGRHAAAAGAREELRERVEAVPLVASEFLQRSRHAGVLGREGRHPALDDLARRRVVQRSAPGESVGEREQHEEALRAREGRLERREDRGDDVGRRPLRPTDLGRFERVETSREAAESRGRDGARGGSRWCAIPPAGGSPASRARAGPAARAPGPGATAPRGRAGVDRSAPTRGTRCPRC